MNIFKFHHENSLKAGCCNSRVAESRGKAEEEIAEHTDGDREDHGNCSTCFAFLLTEEDYGVAK